jgi:hypothetical protein
MHDSETPSFSNGVSSPRYHLSREIQAIECGATFGETSLGPISFIPAGSNVKYGGPGFNAETVRIRWRGKSYYVFRQDLETQHRLNTRYACCGM